MLGKGHVMLVVAGNIVFSVFPLIEVYSTIIVTLDV